MSDWDGARIENSACPETCVSWASLTRKVTVEYAFSGSPARGRREPVWLVVRVGVALACDEFGRRDSRNSLASHSTLFCRLRVERRAHREGSAHLGAAGCGRDRDDGFVLDRKRVHRKLHRSLVSRNNHE